MVSRADDVVEFSGRQSPEMCMVRSSASHPAGPHWFELYQSCRTGESVTPCSGGGAGKCNTCVCCTVWIIPDHYDSSMYLRVTLVSYLGCTHDKLNPVARSRYLVFIIVYLFMADMPAIHN